MTGIVKRLALFFTPTAANAHWVTLDQTGQPPRVVEDIGIPRFELVSLDDAPLAIYRADTGESYERDALAALAELVRVVNGEPNVSTDVDENLRQLREQLRATVDNAETLLGERDATIERIEHQNGCIRQEARRWKSKANAKLEVAEYWEAEARRLAEIATERDAAASAWEVEATQRRSDVEALLDGIDRLEGVVTEMTAQLVDAQANALRTIDRIASALPVEPTEPIIDTEILSPAFEINPCFSSDGDIPTVEISSWRISGRVRVVLNDNQIWDGDPKSENEDRRELTTDLTISADGEMTGNTLAGKDIIISKQLDTIRDQEEKIETLTAERDSALRERDEMAVDRDAADTMRMRLDARLGEERDAYIASSTALQSVIRNYDGLAQYGANLARAVTSERPDLSEAGSLGRAYLREMTTRFGA